MKTKPVNPNWLQHADFWCPWCGALANDEYLRDDIENDVTENMFECYKCSQKFTMSREVIVRYSVEKQHKQ